MFGQRYADARLRTWQTYGDDEQKRRQVIVREIIKKYCEHIDKNVERGTNLLMVGSPGTGKDRMLVSVARAAMCRCFSVRMVSGANLWGETRDLIGSTRLESEFLRKMVEPDCLILSDPLPPQARLTESQASWMYRIIDGRYRNMRPTWLTINIGNRKEAHERMTHQVWDRLRDGAVVCECMWPSYRKVEGE